MSVDVVSDEVLGVVDAWLREYVAVADPRVGRTGPVCPFMPRALKQQEVELRVRRDIDGSSEQGLIKALRAEIDDFGGAEPPKHGSGVLLESTVVVMPELDATGWTRLDAAYEPLKHTAVGSGKMIGNFHPRCGDKAIRNPDFEVSVAPVAMLAIRYMAPHDILFLNDSERWFREYDSRFGVRFARNLIRDPLLLSLYDQAVERHGPSPAAEATRVEEEVAT
jgi:heptaprenyl diphosphate synthase